MDKSSFLMVGVGRSMRHYWALKEAPTNGHSQGSGDMKLALLRGSHILAHPFEVSLHEDTQGLAAAWHHPKAANASSKQTCQVGF